MAAPGVGRGELGAERLDSDLQQRRGLLSKEARRGRERSVFGKERTPHHPIRCISSS